MMKSTLSLSVGGAIALVMTLAAPSAHANTPRYRYVPLDALPLPAPYASFAPSVVVDGVVYGTVYDATYSIASVATLRNGAVTVGPAGSASVANEDGVIGGSDPNSQAALFTGNTTTLVPRLPGEAFASVTSLTDDDLALVASTNGTTFATTYAYDRAGTESVIDFGLPDPVFGAFMNGRGQIGVTKEESQTDPFLHGYKYDPRTAKSTLLPPFSGDPTDVNVLVQGINDRGEVLGYSFTDFSNPAYHERVGVWSTSGVFQPYFYETISTNVLLFNARNEIVITNGFFGPGDGNSYLVPHPGTRLALASIVQNAPAGLQLVNVLSIDNGGTMTGYAADADESNFYPFLLVPMGDDDPSPGDVRVKGCALPSSIRHEFDRKHPHK